MSNLLIKLFLLLNLTTAARIHMLRLVHTNDRGWSGKLGPLLSVLRTISQLRKRHCMYAPKAG
jgi:hypothetical protein